MQWQTRWPYGAEGCQARRLLPFKGAQQDTCLLQVLNAINKGSTAATHKQHNIRFPVHDPSKPQKIKERLATGAEKVFVLVSVMLRQHYTCCRPENNKNPVSASCQGSSTSCQCAAADESGAGRPGSRHTGLLHEARDEPGVAHVHQHLCSKFFGVL